MFAGHVFLKILGSESGCLGLQNQAFSVGCIAKTAFHICRDYVDFGVLFMVFDGFGTNFDDFWWPEGRLETFPGGAEAEDSWPEEGIWYTSWSLFHPPNKQFNMQNT